MKEILTEYLIKFLGYLDFIKICQSLSKIIDISDRDLDENRHDYLWLLNNWVDLF